VVQSQQPQTSPPIYPYCSQCSSDADRLETPYPVVSRQEKSLASSDRNQRRRSDPQQLQQALELSNQCCTIRRISKLLMAPISSPGRAMWHLRLNRLRNLRCQTAGAAVPVGAARRHDLVDIKQLARFHCVGHRITGDPRRRSSPGTGYEKVNAVVNDASPSFCCFDWCAGVNPPRYWRTSRGRPRWAS
jgi:hypothetical protein